MKKGKRGGDENYRWAAIKIYGGQIGEGLADERENRTKNVKFFDWGGGV